VTAAIASAPLRVLIADDASAIRMLLRQILERSRAFVVVGEAADGEAAVRLASTEHPDLVLLDLAMPVLDGLEAIPLIRACSPETQIVVLSGFTAERMERKALDQGADAYIEKRDRPDKLLARLFEVSRRRAGEAAPGEGTAAPAPVAVEEAARRARERFRLAFEHAPIGIALEDLHGRFLQVNGAFCAITGWSVDELLGQTADLIGLPDDVEADGAQRADLAAGAAVSGRREHRYLRPDGRVVWAQLDRSLLRDADGRGLEFVTHVVDVSEQKRVELRQRIEDEASRRYADELARSNTELAHFASVAAHELRSPLQVVSGFASLLAECYNATLDEQGRMFVERIVAGAGRLDGLIEDLLAYSRVGAGDRPATEVDLGSLMAEAKAAVAAAGGAGGARVTWDPLPSVAGDAVQLRQLLENLVANGAKFVAEGTPPEVHVSAERVPEGWCVTVADNGIGVDPARREQVFGMFTRLHSREDYDGTGIGLAICKRIVVRRGGSIWVEANPSGGSRFRFTVPDRFAGSRPATG
jgi:PAS domain S-box-containing protein